MAAFQQLVKLLPAVAGGELLKIDGGGAVGDVGNAGACVSKHSTDRIAHIPKVTTFVPRVRTALRVRGTGWTQSRAPPPRPPVFARTCVHYKCPGIFTAS